MASTIMDIQNPWRDQLLLASFRAATFHVEAGGKESGRRIVMHEYPKKNTPYAEDMGRRAKTFTVRAYCICYPMDLPNYPLYRKDYRIARNLLIDALEAAGPGVLQLPTLPAEYVAVNRYRLTEEEKFGGYCTFDIDFAEYGLPPQYLTPSINTAAVLNTAKDVIRAMVAAGKAGPNPPVVK